MEPSIHEKQPCRRLEFENDEELIDLSDHSEMIESLHSKMSKESIPRVGMEFESEDVAYEFYNTYALAAGFSVRKGNSHKEKGIVLDRTFFCSCQGKRGEDKRDDVYKSHQPETRFGCLAKLKISCRQYCKYRVVIFDAKHNHNLASPSKDHLFRSHRKLSKAQEEEVDIADLSGIAPKNAFEFMARQVGGRENLGFARVDYKNYLRTKRSSRIRSGETGGVLEYMQKMKEEDLSFFYAIQVDEDDLITNIFWADGVMKADYEDFGDVVCFDTTYRKHKDGRPIALFVGVNHHRQTNIFGVALLYDETADTFVWLFDTFVRAMGEKFPKTILTDQDAAMSKALASQWPQTYHRLCICHIFQNVATHLANVFARDKDFSRDFSNCIYGYDHEGDFFDAWNEMLEKYELENNEWLHRMFNIREKWALVYGRDTFCADMTTTQRSESINGMIKHYVNYRDNLRDFFDKFQQLLNDRRYDEMVADFKVSQSKVVLYFPLQILKHAASIYTPKVFKQFEEELCEAIDCQLEISSETGSLVKYMITPHNKYYSYTVSCDETEKTICCTCRKFEFAGLLCSHVLKVLTFQRVIEIPEKYVLKRWTKKAKKGVVKAVGESLTDEIDPKKSMGRRYRDLCRLSTRLVTRAAETEEGFAIVKEGLLNLFNNLDLKSGNVQSSLESCDPKGTDLSPDVPINADGMTKAIKGIKVKPKSASQKIKRPMGGLEIAKRKTRRPKQKKSHEIDVQGPSSNHTEQQPSVPSNSNLALGNQIAQFPGIVPQQFMSYAPSNPALGNQLPQLPGIVPQQFMNYVHPWEPARYNPSMPLEFRQLDMYASLLSNQTNLQYPTQENSEFSNDNEQRRV